MTLHEFDNVDKGILHLLQGNARDITTTQLGEQVDVASSTAGNRINQLEEQGIITGYHPIIDYVKAGLGHQLLVMGAVSSEGQESTVDEIIAVPGVVNVRELMTDNQGICIKLVGHSQEEVEQSLDDLRALGVDICRTELVKEERIQPYNHFGEKYTEQG